MVSPSWPALLLGTALSGAAYAEEEALPEMAFLEYLGMWDDADEEAWPLLGEEDKDGEDETSDPVPQGEEPQETEDER